HLNKPKTSMRRESIIALVDEKLHDMEVRTQDTMQRRAMEAQLEQYKKQLENRQLTLLDKLHEKSERLSPEYVELKMTFENQQIALRSQLEEIQKKLDQKLAAAYTLVDDTQPSPSIARKPRDLYQADVDTQHSSEMR